MCPSAHPQDPEIAGDTNGGNTYPNCVRCKDAITSGHAYELGDDRWHTHCFSCYRCEKPLSCDSDFLVLGTGTLICFDCSDSCKSCGKKIGDLAIILSSSNEAYCSDCFKCCKCGDQIKDLRYAKTKKGLFCIHCHEKLLAKRKNYEEKKRRLKKTLPEIPPSTMELEENHPTNLSEAIVIPEKSSRRPLSPLRDHQRTQSSQSSYKTHLRTNSESVISQYLDGNDSSEMLEDSEFSNNDDNNNDTKLSHSPANGTKHERNVSIDDILNSTLENDKGADGVHTQEMVKKIENTRTLLNKTPLRNNHRHNASFSKSPIDNRRGMILDNSDSTFDLHEPDEDFSESSTDEVQHPITTAINTPTAIQVTSPGKKAHEIFGAGSHLKESSNTNETDEQMLPNGTSDKSIVSEAVEKNTYRVDHLNGAYSTQEKRQGLALTFPSSLLVPHDSSKAEDTLTLGIDSQTLQTITRSSTLQSTSELTNLSAGEQPVSDVDRSNVTQPIAHKKSPSEDSSNTFLLDNSINGGRSIGRSLSMKSKNLVNNLRSRTSSILDPKLASNSNPRTNIQKSPISTPPSSSPFSSRADSFDTHSGWGVSSNNEKDAQRKSPSVPVRRFTTRGRSDGTAPADNKPASIGSNFEYTAHERSHSNTSANSGINVSMYRTPPLDGTPAFSRNSLSESGSHLRNTSWQASVLPVSKEESDESLKGNADNEDETLSQKKIAETELYLKKLKSEIGNLESKKTILTNDINYLQANKDSLTREISYIKSHKENFTSLESLEQTSEDLEAQKMKESNSDNTSPAKQLGTASIVRPAAKPRFWKIFSGGKQQGNPTSQGQQQYYQQQNALASNGAQSTSLSSSSSHAASGNRIEISAPVLQNPNEFSDMKLLPITNKSFSSSSSQSSPSKQEGTILYGSTLVARCAHEQSSIPKLVLECIKQIESNEEFIKSEGIYRKSGSQLLIEQIEKEFVASDANLSPRLEELLNEDVHAVAGVLKRYLRKLPNPVLSFQIYEPLISTVREGKLMTNLPLKNGGNQKSNSAHYEGAIESISKILSHLPVEHYELLKFLVQHIHRVTTFSDYNLMNLYNLSLVFAPGLIRDYDGEKDIIDMKERNYVIGFIVGNYTDIF